jgi:hypothetical protein
MDTQVAVALALTLASACALNWGYLREYGAASKLPPLSVARPLRSLRLLLSSRGWLGGFFWEALGFALYVAALALAPLALVQAVAAGGIGILALLVARVSGSRLDRRERVGVAVSLGGLALLGISLAGGSEHGADGSWPLIALWLGASAGAAALAATSGASVLRGGAAFGVAAGILFAAGDVSTKVVVSGEGGLLLAPAMLGFYAAGTIVLQMGFQRGGALTTAGIATLGTNAIPIAAATTVFAEPLPDGPLGVVRALSFGAVVAGAVALAPRRSTARPSEPGSAPPAAARPAASDRRVATERPAGRPLDRAREGRAAARATAAVRSSLPTGRPPPPAARARSRSSARQGGSC